MIPGIDDLLTQYLGWGWWLLPVWGARDGLCGCGETHHDSRGSIGKHPITSCVPRGYLDASNDDALVRSWWARFPDANPAVNCARSGLVVLDIDPRNGGLDTIKALQAEHVFPPTLAAFTGGGGVHWFYCTQGEARFRGGLGPGVDIKRNGYVLLPPSTHVSGGSYRWAS